MTEELDQMEFLLDHYRNPRNHGTLDNADISHEEGNPSCGDVVRIDLIIRDDRVADVKFTGKGCAISQASASILSELIMDKSLDEVKKISMDDMVNALGIRISPTRLKCAILPLKVVKAGVYGVNLCPDKGK